MKRLMLMLFLAMGITASATDVPQAIIDLNAAVDQLLAPLRNETTEARVNFKDIQTNEERALSLAVSGLFKKTGPFNTVELRIDNLDYNYGDGTQPLTHIKGFLGIDVTKLFPQEQLNRMIPELENLVQSLAGSIAGEYGQAATVKFEVLGRGQDPAGNFTSVRARLEAKIDPALLPQSIKSEDVIFTSIAAELSADLKVGLDMDIKVISNPQYKGFSKDNDGLKEGLEKLLSKDPKVLSDIQKLFADLDRGANQIVNEKGF